MIGETQDKGLGLATVSRNGELAVSAMAAKSKALVEAKFVVAMHRPRNLMEARGKILDACRRPHFARAALYAKPVGGQKMIGPSIRFAETAIQCMTNIDVATTTIYEDEEKRTVNIAVTDLESNLSYSKDVAISKTVERKQLKQGQTPISQRPNSYGEIVYLVAATDDEIQNKISAQESKVIRNCGLRLIPQDIIEEATEIIQETREKGAKGADPKAEIKKVADAFSTLNISPAELEKYLKHSLDTISPKELEDLRDIYTTVKDGEASWASYLNQGDGKNIAVEQPAFGKTRKIDPNDAPPGAEMPPVEQKADTAAQIVEHFVADQGKVSFDDFADYHKTTTGVDLPETGVTSYAELTESIAAEYAKNVKLMKKIVDMHGKKGAK